MEESIAISDCRVDNGIIQKVNDKPTRSSRKPENKNNKRCVAQWGDRVILTEPKKNLTVP